MMKVLIISGSIRSRIENEPLIRHLAETVGDIERFAQAGKTLMEEGHVLSNSEILAAVAMKGALENGCETEYLNLLSLFPRRRESVVQCNDSAGGDSTMDTLGLVENYEPKLRELITGTQGVVLSTPVYFGDRSSVANKFLQLSAKFNLLRGKILGVVSVGAKRNGGQETCNVYSMIEALAQGALVVGNGPPTSQYGGTAVGGNHGHVLDDTLGLRTSWGTGRKVAHVCRQYHTQGGPGDQNPLRINIIVTMDTPESLLTNYVRSMADTLRKERLPDVDFNIHDLTKHTIYRCMGCRSCPKTLQTEDRPARCNISARADDMESLHSSLSAGDGIIIAGLNTLRPEEINFRYQVFTERLRYIRRNDFELTDKLFCGLSYNQFGATINPIHSIKVLTSYIRHNTTFHQPIDIFEHNGSFFNDGLDQLETFCETALRLKPGRMRHPFPGKKYVANGPLGGYK